MAAAVAAAEKTEEEGDLSSRKPVDVVVVPGNGCTGRVDHALWYGWLGKQLKKKGIEARMQTMPDPIGAKETVWLPFMEKTLGVHSNTIIVGHSSGAVAAMRYAETHKVRGIVLVSACWTDLGDELERASGYYARPWKWDAIVGNTTFIDQFGSTDDPFIPWEEMQHVADHLSSSKAFTLHKFDDRGHFNGSSKFRELAVLVQTRAAAAS